MDVRTEAEYNEGHVENSLHVVLDELEYEMDQLKSLKKPTSPAIEAEQEASVQKSCYWRTP